MSPAGTELSPEAARQIAREAERIVLTRQLAETNELIPRHTRLEDAALPATWIEYESLPEPWRNQVASEHPELIRDMHARRVIEAALAESSKVETARLKRLEGFPVKTMAELEKLPADEKEELAFSMTADQRDALAGIPGAPDPAEGWL